MVLKLPEFWKSLTAFQGHSLWRLLMWECLAPWVKLSPPLFYCNSLKVLFAQLGPPKKTPRPTFQKHFSMNNIAFLYGGLVAAGADPSSTRVAWLPVGLLPFSEKEESLSFARSGNNQLVTTRLPDQISRIWSEQEGRGREGENQGKKHQHSKFQFDWIKSHPIKRCIFSAK